MGRMPRSGLLLLGVVGVAVACANDDVDRGTGAVGNGDAGTGSVTSGTGGATGTGGSASVGGAGAGGTGTGGARGTVADPDAAVGADGGAGAPPAGDASPDSPASTEPDAPSGDAAPDAPARPPACGTGIFTHAFTHEAAHRDPPDGSVWFGGDDRQPTTQYPQIHPRNVATGLELVFPYDTLIETLGFYTVSPFLRASDDSPASVTIHAQVRSLDGTVLSVPPPVVVPSSFAGGYFDLPVQAFFPAGVPRVVTMYVEDGLTSGAHTGIAMQGIQIPDDGVIYRADIHAREGETPGTDLDFTTEWDGLWSRSYYGNYPTLRYHASGCQEICAGVICDDGNACTDDVCDKATGACLHPPRSCDDGIGCTVDSCAPATGCVHDPQADLCPDQPHCNHVKACSPITGCGIDCGDATICTDDVCNETTDQCEHSPARIRVEITDDMSYDVRSLRCGSTTAVGSARCSLSDSGELQLEGGPAVTSGCSNGNNQSCCFE